MSKRTVKKKIKARRSKANHGRKPNCRRGRFRPPDFRSSMALLTALDIADTASVWQGLGFVATNDEVLVDGVRHRFGADGTGITSWSLWGVTLPPGPCVVDGLPTVVVDEPDEVPPDPAHPNGVRGLDHLVLTTPDHQRTVAAFEAIGLTVLRVRETERVRQAFFRLGPVILELVGGPAVSGDGPAAFMGLAWTCADLDTTAAFIGPDLHASKEAVQPGRLIASLDKNAGTQVAMAFMSPPPAR